MIFSTTDKTFWTKLLYETKFLWDSLRSWRYGERKINFWRRSREKYFKEIFQRNISKKYFKEIFQSPSPHSPRGFAASPLACHNLISRTLTIPPATQASQQITWLFFSCCKLVHSQLPVGSRSQVCPLPTTVINEKEQPDLPRASTMWQLIV